MHIYTQTDKATDGQIRSCCASSKSILHMLFPRRSTVLCSYALPIPAVTVLIRGRPGSSITYDIFSKLCTQTNNGFLDKDSNGAALPCVDAPFSMCLPLVFYVRPTISIDTVYGVP